MFTYLLSWADSLRSPVVLHEWQAFHSAFCFCFLFLNIHRSGVLKRWHGWRHMKLQPSRRKLCVHHTTMHHVTSCKATYVRCMRVLSSCNLPPALLAEWPGSFTCYCGNTGVERIPTLESAQKVDPGEENSPAAPTGIWTRDLSVTGPAL